MKGLDVGIIITVIGAAFGIMTMLLGVLVRQVFKAIQKDISDISDGRKECERREEKAYSRLDTQISKLRDEWAEFKKLDATMETTRGNRVDALFNVVDHWKDEVRGIKPAIFQRLDQLHQRGTDDLRTDLRDYVRGLIKSGE